MPADMGSLIILESVDSTNNYAMGQIHSGKARDGSAWLAMEQTNGKGRRGTIWQTEKGKNITISIIAHTQFLQVYQQFQLSAAISLSCYDFFKRYHNIDLKIKWPNDLFWNDRKAGGILIENVIKGNIWQWAVIGIGVNINQTAFSIGNTEPVSLKEITGQSYDIIESGKQLYHCVMDRLKQLKASGFKHMHEEYNKVLYKRLENIRLKKQNIVFETTLRGVSALGQLLTADSIEQNFDFGEVEWVL